MANYIRKNTGAALFASASAFLALLSGEAAHAQNVNFYCGNVEFQLDTARSTITNRFLSNEPVQWQYDGEWLRWTVTRSNEAFGVNVLNGYFISGGQSADAGCILADKKILESLPVSEGAHLRVAYIGAPQRTRLEIQAELKKLGYYESEVDGKWGRGTERALRQYISENEKQLSFSNYSSAPNAQETLSAVIKRLGLTFDCADCGDAISAETGTSEIATAPLRVSPDQKNHRTIFEQLSPSCRSLKPTSLVGAQAQEWSSLGGDRSIMFELERSSDSFFNGDENTFRRYLELSQQFGNFPPLQFAIGYGYWQRNNFEGSVTWLSKAARNGEPNAAYLIALISLNNVDSNDKLKLDSSMPRGPLNVQLARQCLETTLGTDDFLVVHGVMHQSYFKQSAAELLVPIYLQKKEYIFRSPDQADFKVSWSGRDEDLDRAVDIINAMKSQRSESCDANCWREYEAEARRQLDDRKAALEAAAEAKRAASVLDENALAKVIAKCDRYTTLKSICWAQTAEERERVLASRGYTCANEPNIFGMQRLVCKSGSMRIDFSGDSIAFNCENFNTCRYEFKEVAEMLVNQGIVPKLEFKTRTVSDGVNTFLIEEYCGRGRQADELCVTKDMNLLGLPIVSVTINSGASGEAAPNFD